jgi:asparaginyl-tRNA synthetase
VKVVGASDDSYPIQPKPTTAEFLRTIPEMRGKAMSQRKILIARSALSGIIHSSLGDFFGMFQYYTPIITQDDCEGAGETFKVSSEWLEANLTVSGQLHAEVGMMALGKVYTFSPCFRAEKSTTRKHLSEFWMVEPEMAHYDLAETIAFCESFIRHVILGFRMTMSMRHKYEEFAQPYLVEGQAWKITTYDQVCSQYGLEYGKDIGTELENKIVADNDQMPVFITHYPQELKPFYMAKKDGKALCFDLIFPEVGELVGGSQREEDHDRLRASMIESGLDVQKMQWYLNTRKWGSVPHSGFGMGFERLLMYLTGAEKVHDVIPFPVSF